MRHIAWLWSACGGSSADERASQARSRPRISRSRFVLGGSLRERTPRAHSAHVAPEIRAWHHSPGGALCAPHGATRRRNWPCLAAGGGRLRAGAAAMRPCEPEGRIMAVNALAPEQMSAAQRLQEVVSLLSAGFLRYWLRKVVDGRENGLAIPRTSSDECVEPKSGGETHG